MQKLMEKLLVIQSSIDSIVKGERNEYQQFDYVSSTQVLKAVRSEMAKAQVLLIPEVDRGNYHKFDNQVITELTITFTWVNVEAPDEKLTIPWYAQGCDTQEKGVGKALTYAEKFFILKFFHIPTDKDDPDAARDVPNSASPDPLSPDKPMAEPINKNQMADIFEKIDNDLELSRAMVTDFLSKKNMIENNDIWTLPKVTADLVLEGWHDFKTSIVAIEDQLTK